MELLNSILVFLTPILISMPFWVGFAALLLVSGGRIIPAMVGGVTMFGFGLLVSSNWQTFSFPNISAFSTTLQSGTQYMETFFGFLTGAFVFWPIVFMILCLEITRDSEWWAAATLVGAAVLYCLIKDVPLTWETTRSAVNYVAGYVAFGLLFTFAKWWVYINKAGTRFQEFAAKELALTNKSYYERVYGSDRQYPGEDGDTPYYNRQNVASRFVDRILSVKDKGGKWDTSYQKRHFAGYLTAWTVFWPVYAFLIVCEDMIKEFMNWFVEMFGHIYKRMADAAFNKPLTT